MKGGILENTKKAIKGKAEGYSWNNPKLSHHAGSHSRLHVVFTQQGGDEQKL